MIIAQMSYILCHNYSKKSNGVVTNLIYREDKTFTMI